MRSWTGPGLGNLLRPGAVLQPFQVGGSVSRPARASRRSSLKYRLSRVARTWPAFTVSPSSTSSVLIRPSTLKARLTWRTSILPCSTRFDSISGGRVARYQAAMPSPALTRITTARQPQRRRGRCCTVGRSAVGRARLACPVRQHRWGQVWQRCSWVLYRCCAWDNCRKTSSAFSGSAGEAAGNGPSMGFFSSKYCQPPPSAR